MRSLCIVAAALMIAVCAEDAYVLPENVDFAAAFADKPKLKAFVDCFTDVGDCDTNIAPLKKNLPEAIREACAKCNQAQKHTTDLFLKALKKHLPEEDKVFRNKYDPENKYFSAFEAAVANN